MDTYTPRGEEMIARGKGLKKHFKSSSIKRIYKKNMLKPSILMRSFAEAKVYKTRNE